MYFSMTTAKIPLDRFPTVPLVGAPTPIQRMDRLAAALKGRLQGVQLYVKRDDFMPLGGGGNKLRKLEFLLGNALAHGADTVITVGGLQSNHARLTAAAAAVTGLACELVLSRAVPRDDAEYEHNGNMLLDPLFGARVTIAPAGTDSLAAAQARAEALRAQGRRVVVLPTGGSTPLGSLGYVSCAQEILNQERELGVEFSTVAVANGSGGTQAGLVTGFHAAGRDPGLVQGYGVLAVEAQTIATTHALVAGACELLGLASPAVSAIRVNGSHRGEHYGAATPGMLDAVTTVARSEGWLLDPVYSGKAFAGLLADIEQGKYAPGSNVLFVMTGGQPGLFAYRSAFEPTRATGADRG